MPLDQLDFILQFCLRIAGLLVIAAVAKKIARVLARPCGTYGPGLPERRSRPRMVLRDPAVIRPVRQLQQSPVA